MKHIKYIYFFMIILASCQELPKVSISAGAFRDDAALFSSRATHCLRTFLIGEDAGGSWTIVEMPSSSILLQSDLDGTDNPCIDFDSKGCGIYRLKYLVINDCCRDSSIVKINKKCCNIISSINCN